MDKVWKPGPVIQNIQNPGSSTRRLGGWVGLSWLPCGKHWRPRFKAPAFSALGTNLFLDGPSSKSEELTSLLVEDTWDASSFSFSDCSDAGPNPLDWPLPRSPTGEKRGQRLKTHDIRKQHFTTVTPTPWLMRPDQDLERRGLEGTYPHFERDTSSYMRPRKLFHQ